MAIFYPNNPLYYNNSYGEKQIYEALHKLNDDYIIFYSTMWQKKNKSGNINWGEADFTIFNKKKGILVVEVKSGEIAYKNNEWYQTRIDTKETHIMQNPLAQADKSKYRFIDLLKHNIPFGEKCIVEKIVWFPSIPNLDNIWDLPLEYSKEIILTAEALEKPEEYLNKAFNYYNMPYNFSLTKNSIDRVLNILAPEFNLVTSPTNRKKELDFAFLRLTDEQIKLLDYIEEQKFATIQGTAGTGKTLIALEAAKRLASDNKEVLFLCFNKFLYQHLSSTHINENIDFFNLHSYLSIYSTEISTPEEMLTVLKNISINDFGYDSIIIDEGQDFPECIIEEFYNISKNIQGKFLIFYDKNQIIYKNRYPNWIINAECKLLLTKNCRNTYQIAITSNNILNIPTIQNNNSIKGEMPLLRVYDNESIFLKKLEQAISELRKDGFNTSDITILTLSTEKNSILNKIDKIGNYYITNESNRSDNEIFFTTSRKFKGLESNAIIIIDIDNNTFNNDIEKNNFYVAASRAKQRLTILIDNNKIDSIANEITDIKLSNNLGKISTKLKVKPIK